MNAFDLLHYLHHHGLSVLDGRVLQYLNAHDSATMGFLAAELDISPPMASNVVGRLVEKGYLARRQSSEDRRQIVVELTKMARFDLKL